MAINQPSPDVTLPEELQRAVDASRNLVTVNEAEAIRLRELANSSQYTVNELHKAKADMEAQIAGLEAKKAELQKQCDELSSLVSQQFSSLDSVSKDLSDKREEYLAISDKIVAESVVLEEKNKELDAREAALCEKEKLTDTERASLEAKLAKLQEVADLMK